MSKRLITVVMALVLTVALAVPLVGPGAAPVSASPGEVTLILRPDGAGTHTEFGTLVGAATNWQAVDEEVADEDASYISEASSDKRDTFNVTDSGLTGGCIISVKVVVRAKQYDDRNGYMQIMITSGGTDYTGSYYWAGKSYNNKSETWTTDPFTGSPWTWAAVDALEAGVKTGADWSGARITQVWVEVTYCPLCATLRPGGVGTYTQFDTVVDPDTDPDYHWEAVDEVVADTTSYIADDDYGEMDTFTLTGSGLATDDCINYIIVGVRAKEYDSNDDKMRIMIRSGVTDATSGDKGLTGSYENYYQKWTNDPNTGSPWTTAAVDALEAGVKNTDGARVTQVWVDVCAEPAVTLDMVADGDGKVHPASGGYCLPDITINATADCPGAFAGWTTADMSEIANPTFSKTTLTLDKDKTVTGHFVSTVAVQLAMVLDGSGSISSGDFERMTEGLADAVDDDSTHLGCFVRDGTLELTVVQFGDGRADLEVGPVAIIPGNAATVADEIRSISKMEGYTPLACGIYLAADVLAGDPNDNLVGTPWEGLASCVDSDKQIINIVTDGEPNRCCDDDDDLYNSDTCGDAYVSAVDARDYAIDLLDMDTDPQDRILAETRNSIEWFRLQIVWPQVGVMATLPTFPQDKGWVYQITSFGGACTGWQAPNTSVVTGTVTNPDNAYDDSVEGAAYATFASDGATCNYSGYDFSSMIPNASAIDGIEVMLDARASGSGDDNFDVELWDGSAWTTTGYTVDPSDDSWNQYTRGGSSDNWGTAWTPGASGNLKNLKVRVDWDVTGEHDDGWLDWVPVDVCYNVYPQEFYDVFCAKLFVEPTGACCDPADGTCEDGVTEGCCQPPLQWTEGGSCDQVTCVPKMTIDKDTSTPTITPGGTVTYTISVTNTDTATAVNVSIFDTLPGGFTFATEDSIIATGGVTSPSTVGPSVGQTALLWGYWTIPSGDSVVINFTADVPEDITPGTYQNTAYADGDNFAQIDDEKIEAGDADTPGSGIDTGTDEDVEVVSDEEPPPTGVPTLSQWGMIAMGILFAAFLIWTVRRRWVVSADRS